MKAIIKEIQGLQTLNRLFAAMVALGLSHSAGAAHWAWNGGTPPSYWADQKNWYCSGASDFSSYYHDIKAQYANNGSGYSSAWTDNTIYFNSLFSLKGELPFSAGSTSNPVRFVADDPGYGITSTKNLMIDGSDEADACLEIVSGIYSFLAIYLGNGDGCTSTIKVSGGSLKCKSSSGYNYLSIGRADNCTATMTVSSGGSYDNLDSYNTTTAMAYGSGSSATLNVAGGTFTLKGPLHLNYNSGAVRSTVNITGGGVLTAERIQLRNAGTGGGTVTLDGGTVKAYTDSYSFIPAHSSLHVYVGANGATIDTDGYDITIGEDLENKPGAVGTATFTGGGVVSLTGSNSYTGTTTIDIDTALSTTAGAVAFSGPLVFEEGSRLKVSRIGASAASAPSIMLPTSDMSTPIAVDFDDSTVVIGSYPILTITGEGSFAPGDAAKFGLGDNAQSGSSFSVSQDGKSIVLTMPSNEAIWTGGANDGRFSSAGNWSDNAIPGDDKDVVFNVASETTLICDMTLNVNSIMFAQTCAKVTISGDCGITGLEMIANLSEATHVFEVPVEFADTILVIQGAKSWDSKTMPSVRFAGGVTGTSFANGTTHYLDGAFRLSSGEGWTAKTSANDSRWGMAEGSSLALPSATDTAEFALGDGSTVGGAFTTGVFRTSSRLLCWNKGEFVVTNELEVTMPEGGLHCAHDCISGGKFKFEKATINSEYDATFKFGTDDSSATDAGTQYFYIGSGGLCFGAGAHKKARYETGGAANIATVRVDPWHGDYTIHAKDAADDQYDFCVSTTTYFGTTDENGAACAVTADGIINSYGSAADIHIDGAGRFVVNAVNACTCPVTVHDGATLAVRPGKKATAGALTVNANATLEVAESGTVASGGALSLKSGACLGFNYTTVNEPVLDLTGKTVTLSGTVVVKVSGARPRGGANVLTSGGKFTGATVILSSDAPTWAEGVSVNGDGNIVLDVAIPVSTFFVR